MATLYEEKQRQPQSHALTLNDRKRLSISGVEDVEAFEEETVILSTVGGALTIRGGGLRINRLSLDGGELLVEGRIDGLDYSEEREHRRGFLGKLLG